MKHETLFQFVEGTNRWRCELFDLEARGVEAQFFRNDEFNDSHRFRRSAHAHALVRDLAIAWANMKRRARESR